MSKLRIGNKQSSYRQKYFDKLKNTGYTEEEKEIIYELVKPKEKRNGKLKRTTSKGIC